MKGGEIMYSQILVAIGASGFVVMAVAAVIRKQYIYALAFWCALVWVVFASINVPQMFFW